MTQQEHSTPAGSKNGVFCALGAYLAWGLFPLYWHPLASVPAIQILGHRLLWSAVLVFGILMVQRNWGWVRQVIADKRILGFFLMSSTILSSNWLLYIWAVNNGHVIESSLGYFINPLMSVLLGRVMLNERLSRMQLLAITLATLGVVWLTWQGGRVPWIALGLAITFSVYGFLRKIGRLPSLEGLALETFLMLPLAIAVLCWFEWQGTGSFGHAGWGISTLLIGSGIVTAIPLLWFAAGARQLTLTTLGLLQYVAPTCQFLLGVWVFHEPFDSMRLVGYILIWSGLVVYSGAGLWSVWNKRRLAGQVG